MNVIGGADSGSIVEATGVAIPAGFDFSFGSLTAALTFEAV